MKVTVIFKSGKEVVFECKNAKVSSDRINNSLTEFTLEGVTGQRFLFMKLGEVAAVIYDEEEKK